MRWTDIPIHVIDFEGSVSSGILEFGVVTLSGAKVAATRTRLCRAMGRVRSEDEALHGLSAGRVATEAPFVEEFDYFARLRESGPLAAHYAQAENTMIKAVWPYPRLCPDFARPGGVLAEWGPWIDPGRIYAEVFPQLDTGRLADLVQGFALQEELEMLAAQHCPADRRHFHAALYDALAAALLLLALGRRPEFAEVELAWLLQRSTADSVRRERLGQEELF